ncbi:MAG: hypothetical protein ABIV93_03945 [Byssovorax sp.]
MLDRRQRATTGPIEILAHRLQLDGHEDTVGLTFAEEAQRSVDGFTARPHALLRHELPAFGAALGDGAVAEGVAEDARQKVAVKGDLFLVVEAATLQRVDEAEHDRVAAIEVVREGERGDLLGVDANVEERSRAKERGHARR